MPCGRQGLHPEGFSEKRKQTMRILHSETESLSEVRKNVRSSQKALAEGEVRILHSEAEYFRKV